MTHIEPKFGTYENQRYPTLESLSSDEDKVLGWMSISIERIFGAAPVQAEGHIMGNRFYFRSRYSTWSFSSNLPGYDGPVPFGIVSVDSKFVPLGVKTVKFSDDNGGEGYVGFSNKAFTMTMLFHHNEGPPSYPAIAFDGNKMPEEQVRYFIKNCAGIYVRFLRNKDDFIFNSGTLSAS